MKKIIYVTTIAAALSISNSCKEDDQNPLESLPPATQQGLNTFGCLVNGTAWIPVGYTGISNLDISYDPEYHGGTFDLATYRVLSEEDRQYMYIYSTKVNDIGNYPLNDLETGGSTFNHYQVCNYNRDPSIFRKGTLTITHFDLENQVISGTFEFTLAKPGCDTIRVTEGRFDMKI